MVKCVAFSPDGKTLVAASEHSISVWATRTWRTRESLPCGATSLAFAGEGQLLAAGLWFQDIVRVSDLSTRSPDSEFKTKGRHIQSVALAPNGAILAAGEYGGLHLWDIRSGKELVASARFRTEVGPLAFSPDGKLLAVGDVFGGLALWDVSAGKLLGLLNGHRNCINSVAYSGDGATLVSGAADGTIRLWEVRTRRERLRITADFPFSFFQLTLRQDGERIAAVGDDGIVKLWDAADGKEVAELRQHERGFSIAFSSDGKLLAVGLRTKVKVWKLVNKGR